MNNYQISPKDLTNSTESTSKKQASFLWRSNRRPRCRKCYEHKLVTIPHSKISNKLIQLMNVSSQYDTYISKIKASIDEIVDKDQSLAAQIGGLS
ncbi:hypothetical protein [Staphylococcus simulans]|uniref:hypothetical protein n=1 Tax=Staphylococcus simulans TaxID=1286 RepID=UPI003F812DCC